jgi:hypothetical protein
MTAETEKEMEAQGVYLYAIGPELPVQDLGAIGVEGSEVYTIAEGPLRAVVSDVPFTRELRPERRHLAAHQAVVNAVLERSPVTLPVSFGTIADNENGVRELLRRHADQLSEQMERVKGMVQMNVRLSYAAQTPGVFEYLLNERRPDLRSLRDAIFGGGRTPTREEKIDFGQKIEAALNELRDELTQQIEQALSPRCSATKVLSPRSEQELVRLACLVAKDSTGAFDSAVQEAARSFDDRFVFEQSGPFPAYDFTELHLSVEEGAEEGTDVRADT